MVKRGRDTLIFLLVTWGIGAALIWMGWGKMGAVHVISTDPEADVLDLPWVYFGGAAVFFIMGAVITRFVIWAKRKEKGPARQRGKKKKKKR